MGPLIRIGIFAIAMLGAASVFANCGNAYCSINTNAEIQFESAEPGLRLHLRYEFVDLDQIREGSHKVGAQQQPEDHDELETTNQNLVVGLDYVVDEHWSVAAHIPYLKRKHAHIHNPDADALAEGEAPQREEWNFSGLGDVRMAGRYHFAVAGADVGIHAGLKLPTGKWDERNDAGELAERTLQLGTGSTDIVGGAFAKGTIADAQLRWFAQSQWQRAIASKGDFRPGDEITADFGLHYTLSETFTANLQLNTRYKRRDAGANAEPDESGGKFVYISPGLSYTFAGGLQMFGYAQLPLYQNVNGIQLTLSTSYVAGLSYRF